MDMLVTQAQSAPDTELQAKLDKLHDVEIGYQRSLSVLTIMVIAQPLEKGKGLGTFF